MNIQRIRSEVAQAANHFAMVETHPTTNGGVYAKAALQTSARNTYIIEIHFPDYPNRMPTAYVKIPILEYSPHKYDGGSICYLHPSMWNPGLHDVTFVVSRVAKWLNKYEVYRTNGRWPGAEVPH